MKGDLILTKSLSRFARNTVDSLVVVRMLRANGIGFIFEKGNINTLTESSEFLLTLFSGFAQAESESISKNVIWGIQKSREAGNVPFQYQKLLSYQRGPDGQPEIVPEEAEVVKRIYRRYLDGCSLAQIKRELEADGVPTASGIRGWTYQVVRNILTTGERTMEIYITGDLHGDLRRFQPGIFYEQESLTKEDTVLVAGDFGCVWHGDGRDDEGLDWLEVRPFTTAFVTGNHENYDALRTYPLEEWRGGSIRRIRPSVILLERGQIFSLGGKRFFTIGGDSSHDIQDGILALDDPLFKNKCKKLDARGAMYRVNHLSWWKEELPSEAEYQTARACLGKAGWEVDYIITHCCPSSVQDTFSGGLFRRDALTEFFDEVRQRCQFKYWFFGHYHEDMVIEKKYVMLYEQIIRLKL